MGMFDVPVFSKYILGRTRKNDGSLIYGELLEEPKDTPTVTAAAASSNQEEKDFPRVEELPDEEPETTTD